jgi:hypothetical protein
MKIKLLPVLSLAFLFSCQGPEKKETASVSADTLTKVPAAPPEKKEGVYIVEGDSLRVPAFDVQIELSEKAKQRILGKRESIVVDVFLEGTPKAGSRAKLEEDGSFFLGSVKREIRYGQTAHIDDLKFPIKLFDQLEDKDADLTVNVYTGRHTSPDNLITGDFLGDKVSKIAGRNYVLKYKLIYGDE